MSNDRVRTSFFIKLYKPAWLLCFVLFAFHGLSQKINEKGLLNIRNYLPKEYGAQPQNLCALQDERGIMYFGNNSGVLEYDGFYWRIIKVSNETSVSALAKDNKNVVYAGAENDLGKLVPGKDGTLLFKSLTNQLPADQRDFGRIFRIVNINDTICFQSRKYIFRWVKNRFISTITTTRSFHLAFNVNNKLWVRVRDEGICILSNDKLVKLNNSEIFATELVYEILWFQGKLCFVTGTLGIFEYNKNEEFIPVFQEIENAYAAVVVNNTYMAVGTFNNGLILLNKDFKAESNIGLSTGLQDGTVNNMFLDREQNLWLLLNRGIAKIEVVSPISVHNYDTGLKGTVEDIIRYKGNLFVATQNGVFYFNNETSLSNKFKQIENLDVDCYSLTTFVRSNDTILLVAGVDGVYDISKNNAIKITAAAPWKIAQSLYDKEVLIIANDDGLSYMRWKNGTWTTNMYVRNVPEQIYNFAQSKKGDLWLGTAEEGVIRLQADFYAQTEPPLKKYGREKGIPDGPVFVYCDNRDDIYLGSDNGVFAYISTEDKFAANKKFGLSKKTCGIHRISKDIYGNFWISVFYPDNTYDIYMGYEGAWNKTPFLRYNSEVFQAAYHDARVTWLGSATGLIRFETDLQKKYDSPFYVNLRLMSLGKNHVFHGSFTQPDSTIRTTQGDLNQFEFSYSRNSFIFEFSASSFFDERSTRYSYKLVGLEETWSEWSLTPRAEYNYVPEGEYVLMVKARNVYGNVSKTMRFRFAISPPWYRTIWAYISYVVIFILIIWIAVLVSTRSLKRIIKERTTEVVHQKEEIEHQKEILEEKNKDILDSIKYAKRIQDAILPSETRMAEALKKELFILFKPKDIVSGDFYWMHSSEEVTFFSAIDCT
ncbi:MAG: triple tyrosine motif-containing protein, partial [Flavobacteriales bacterium]